MRDDSPILATITAARAEGLSDREIDERVWELHGKDCAMLALDSSGMTRTTRSLGIVHFLDRYWQMREVAEPILEASACLGWRSFADNLFAEFQGADAALTVALNIHQEIRERGLMLTANEPYRVCIGVGYGRVLANGAAGVMGDEMNLVAKLAEDIAEAGDTLVTSSAYASLKQSKGVRMERLQRTLSKVAVDYFRVVV
jgi:adenylate cyclase